MRPKYHFISSLIIGSTLYLITHHKIISFSASFAAFFIDLDHLIIYWRTKPKNPFSIKKFLNCKSYIIKLKKLYLFFHAWEWVLVFLILWITLQVCRVDNFDFELFLGLSIGILVHLILDQIRNSVYPGTYSFFWRLTKKFETGRVLRKIK